MDHDEEQRNPSPGHPGGEEWAGSRMRSSGVKTRSTASRRSHSAPATSRALLQEHKELEELLSLLIP